MKYFILLLHRQNASIKRTKENNFKNVIMIRQEILEKLKTDSVLITKISAELGKPFPTVKSWVQRESSRLQEYPFLKVLAEMLGKEIEDLVEDKSC